MTDPSSLTDEHLFERMRLGDEDAFVTLYRRRKGAIYGYAMRMTGSKAMAEDVTQEVFLAIICNGERYDPSKGKLSSYLMGAARNQVLRRLEKDRPFDNLPGSSGDRGAARAVSFRDPVDELSRDEKIACVRQLILSLPPAYREVVVLCDLQEMSYAEAAAVIGRPEGTIRSRLSRARTMLAEKLREQPKAGLSISGAQSARCPA